MTTPSRSIVGIVVVVIPLVAGGCGGLRVHELADGRAVPASWVSCPIREPGQARAKSPLDDDALYVMEPGPPFGIPSDRNGWEMSYYRFWPGGQVLMKPRFGDAPDHTIPTADQGDDFAGRTTGVGRYDVVGGRLRMAFIGFDENGWGWSDVVVARVNDDGSFTIPGRPATAHEPKWPDRIVRRHKVEGMKRFPDW